MKVKVIAATQHDLLTYLLTYLLTEQLMEMRGAFQICTESCAVNIL